MHSQLVLRFWLACCLCPAITQDIAAQPESVTADSTDAALLEQELARELGQSGEAASLAESELPGGPKARPGLFQNMNPNISIIGSLLGSGTDYSETSRNLDLSLDEVEFSFQAAVDPYARADIFFSFPKHQEPFLIPGANADYQEENHRGVELEEAAFTVLSMPWHTQLKAGKFRMKFNKINETHPHAYHFIDTPYMYLNYFGPDGLNDEGLSLSWLVPNKAFFQDLTVQVTSGPDENASFARADNNRLLYLGHIKNFFDLNENTTLELGATGLTGPNNSDGTVTDILAADLTIKWKPLRYNRYRSFELLSEFLWSNRRGPDRDASSYGLFLFLRYQMAQRWFLGGMYDYAEFPEFAQFHVRAYSGVLQYFATEFQKLEFQYRRNSGDFFDDFNEVKVRAVFVIGSHGAHQY
jgi:hypothetical protein